MRDKTNDPLRLSLMMQAISNIESFMVGVNDYDVFVNNKLLSHAVIYNLQCIGESVYMLSQDYKKEKKHIQWKSIEGLRHVLVHDYYQVEMRLLWSVLKNDLTPLKEFLLTQDVVPLEDLKSQ